MKLFKIEKGYKFNGNLKRKEERYFNENEITDFLNEEILQYAESEEEHKEMVEDIICNIENNFEIYKNQYNGNYIKFLNEEEKKDVIEIVKGYFDVFNED